jgi:hypothetical protein
MSSWGSDSDGLGARDDDAPEVQDPPGDDASAVEAAPATDDPTPDEAAAGRATSEDAPTVADGGTGLPMADDPAPGDDPLPSAGSLRWAPDVTERIPTTPPAPATVPPAPAVALPAPPPGGTPDAPPAAATAPPAAPVVADPTGAVRAPASPAYADPPGRPVAPFHGDPPGAAGPSPSPAPGPPSPDGHGRHRRRTESLVLVALGVLVVVVGVVAMAIAWGGEGDDGTDASAPATDAPVAGPIVAPTGVVGTWDGSSWQPRPDGEQPGAGLEYAVVGLGDEVGSASGAAVSEDCPSQRGRSELDVAVVLEASGAGPSPIAVAGVDDPLPRTVEQFDTGSATYRDAAAEVARGLGATTDPTLTQLLRVDLDGNGTEEVVVAAEHLSDPDGLSSRRGDWSVVFLRRVAGDGVATDVLASSVVGGGEGGDIESIRTAAIADLNGDGTMEIALDGRSASAQWTSVHALSDDGVPSQVLEAGCDG